MFNLILGLSSKAGQNLDLSQTFHGMFYKKTVEDIEWSRVSEDGTKVKIAYCSLPSPCRLVEDCISSCPEYLRRLITDGLSIILLNVTQADRGLEFQCEIHPKIMTKGPEVYMIKINYISPGEGQCDSRQLGLFFVSDSLIPVHPTTDTFSMITPTVHTNPSRNRTELFENALQPGGILNAGFSFSVTMTIIT